MAIALKYVVGSEQWNAGHESEYRKVFGISSKNTLELTNYSNDSRHTRDDDGYSFVEKDQNVNAVAPYEAWHHMSTPKSFSTLDCPDFF